MGNKKDTASQKQSTKCCKLPLCHNVCHKREPCASWLNLVCVFVVHNIVILSNVMLAVIYDILVEKYDVTKANVGITGSLQFIFSAVSALLGSAALSTYGKRLVSLTGSLFISLGYVGAAFAPNIICIHIFLGALLGLGYGTLNITASTIIQESFSHNRGLATGISLLGFSTGFTVGPVLLDYLLVTYGLPGCLLISGGVAAQIFVMSLLLQNPHLIKHDITTEIENDLILQVDIENDQESQCETDIMVRKHSDSHTNTSLSSSLVEMYYEDNNLSEKRDSAKNLDKYVLSRNISEIYNTPNYTQIINQMEALTSEESSTLDYISSKKAEDDLINTLNSEYIEANSHISKNTEDVRDRECVSTSTNKDKSLIVRYFIKLIDMAVCKNVRFVLLVVTRCTSALAKQCLLLHAVSCALMLGVNEQNARYLPAIMGITNLVMRCFSSVIMNFKCVNTEAYFTVGLSFLVFAGFLASFAGGYSSLALAMACYGLSEGIAYTALPVVVVHVVGVEAYAKALSLMDISLLPASIAAGPFSGWLADVSGGYRDVFLFAATSALVSVIAAMVILLLTLKPLRLHCKSVSNQN